MTALAMVITDGTFQLLPMRNILVPHVGQTPWVADLPFFMVMALASFISFFARHLTQYACILSSLICIHQAG